MKLIKIVKNEYFIIFLAIISIILLYVIFQCINYISIKDNFTNKSTSHNVDMPLNTIYSCKNFCNPTSRCAITGQQCFADIDCPGCKPYKESVSHYSKLSNLIGNNDAGKLTVGVTPQYSLLTSGFGTHQKVINKNNPAKPNLGLNTWRDMFDKGRQLYDKRYKPKGLLYMPKYESQYSITGEFIGDGPLPSNY